MRVHSRTTASRLAEARLALPTHDSTSLSVINQNSKDEIYRQSSEVIAHASPSLFAAPGDKQPAGSGRKAGTPNRITRKVREALIAAFDELGGEEYLVQLGRDDPATFARLLSRLIPNVIAARMDRDEVVHRIHVGPPPSSS